MFSQVSRYNVIVCIFVMCITEPHPDIATASSLHGGVHGTWSRPFGTGTWKQVPPRLAPGLFMACSSAMSIPI